MEDKLHERGKSLEDAFFFQVDNNLLQKLQDDLAGKEAAKHLAVATGISDQAVLDKLIGQHITAESLVCVSMVPLVAVAWADGTMQDQEREAILKAAHENGIEDGTLNAQLLDSWLKNDPHAELLDCWKAYVQAMKATTETVAYNQMKNTVMHRAKTIAKAAGGFLGMNAISDSEKHVLDDVEKAFG